MGVRDSAPTIQADIALGVVLRVVNKVDGVPMRYSRSRCKKGKKFKHDLTGVVVVC